MVITNLDKHKKTSVSKEFTPAFETFAVKRFYTNFYDALSFRAENETVNTRVL